MDFQNTDFEISMDTRCIEPDIYAALYATVKEMGFQITWVNPNTKICIADNMEPCSEYGIASRLNNRRKRKELIRIMTSQDFISEFIATDPEAQRIYSNNQKKLTFYSIQSDSIRRYFGTEKNVVIPDGISAIEDRAFAGNDHICSVFIPKKVHYISSRVFENCPNLRKIIILGEPHIRNLAFENTSCSLIFARLSLSGLNPKIKIRAALGFAEDWFDQKHINSSFEEEYLEYIKRNRKKLYSFGAEFPSILLYMVEKELIPKKQIQDVIDIAQRSGKFEVVAALLEYSQKLREKRELL